MKKTILLFGLLLACSFAAYGALSKSSGYYLEGNLGVATNTNWAGTLNGGYKFSCYSALEGGVAKLEDTYIDVALKGSIPFDSGFDLFAKVGPAIKPFNMNTLALYTGVGASYAFTNNLSGNVQGLYITDDNFAATFGLSYIF